MLKNSTTHIANRIEHSPVDWRDPCFYHLELVDFRQNQQLKITNIVESFFGGNLIYTKVTVSITSVDRFILKVKQFKDCNTFEVRIGNLLLLSFVVPFQTVRYENRSFYYLIQQFSENKYCAQFNEINHNLEVFLYLFLRIWPRSELFHLLTTFSNISEK